MMMFNVHRENNLEVPTDKISKSMSIEKKPINEEVNTVRRK